MLNLKSQKGSITLFVLVSGLFFISSITCSQLYMQSKQIAIDREYRQIKQNYEYNINNTYLDETYNRLLQLKSLNISVEKAVLQNNQLIVDLLLNNTVDLNIKTLKYGWGTTSTIDSVNKWSYIEAPNTGEKITVINNNAQTSGTYNLFLVINEQENYIQVTV